VDRVRLDRRRDVHRRLRAAHQSDVVRSVPARALPADAICSQLQWPVHLLGVALRCRRERLRVLVDEIVQAYGRLLRELPLRRHLRHDDEGRSAVELTLVIREVDRCIRVDAERVEVVEGLDLLLLQRVRAEREDDAAVGEVDDKISFAGGARSTAVGERARCEELLADHLIEVLLCGLEEVAVRLREEDCDEECGK